MPTGKWTGMCGCLLIVASLCLSSPLYAVETTPNWRIGIYQVSTSTIPSESFDWILSMVTERLTFKTNLTTLEAEYVNGLDTFSTIETIQTENHAVWTGEDKAKVAGLSQLMEPPSTSGRFSAGLPMEYVHFDTTPVWDALFLRGDQKFISTLGKRERLSGVLVIWPSMMENLLRLRVVYHDLVTGGHETLFDRLVALQDAQELQDELLLSLLPLSFGTDVSLLNFEHAAPGLTVKIADKDYPIIENEIIVPAGENVLELAAFGYEPKQVSIVSEAGENITVDGSLKLAAFGPLSICSSTGKVDWFVNGIRQNGLPILFQNQMLPLNIVASRQGFISSAIQSTTPMKTIVFDLKPEWMSDENLIARNRDSFYYAMGRALGAFGMWIGLQSMATTFSDSGTSDPLWQPWIFLSAGVAVVSVVDLVGGLLAYYTGTRYSTP